MKQNINNFLKVAGKLAEGKLSSLENIKTGMRIACDPEKYCWEIAVQAANEIKTLSPDDFEFRPVSDTEGQYIHREMDLTLTLKWRQIGTWAAACNLGFKAGPDVRVAAVSFVTPGRVRPCEDDNAGYLIYPFKTGIKISNPARALFQAFRCKDTEYGPGEKLRHLNVIESGLAPVTTAGFSTENIQLDKSLKDCIRTITDDCVEWGRDSVYTYPATISMTWMDYCGPQGGIYLGMHDPSLEKAGLFLRAERDKPGIIMGADKIFNRQLTQWNGDFVIGLHDQDWHQGADFYREYMTSRLPAMPPTPEYFKQAPGIISHYDLKWEDGTIIHRYDELPEMHREAMSLGYNIMLLAGWNNGGFDNYSVQYATDDDLGSENQLKESIKKVHKAGGKVFFYVNALSISRDCPEFDTLGRQYAVRDLNGEIDYFGEFFLVHPMATMCSNVGAWREAVKRNIKYVLLELGADGVYLDQIGSAPRDCYAPDHDHDSAWAMSYRKMLAEVREELASVGKKDYVLLTERAMDLHKDLLDCFLCYSFWQAAPELCFPEMFRYTFPEVLLIDMAMQKPWAAKYPAENIYVKEIFCRQFIHGLKYWIYCHVPENEELKPFFRNAMELYKSGVAFFTEGKFLDDLNICDKTPGITVKEFAIPNGKRLFTVWNPTGLDAQFKINAAISSRVIRYTLEQPIQPESTQTSSNTIQCGNSLLAFIEV
jgi:Domain of unknown function (DUF6259)